MKKIVIAFSVTVMLAIALLLGVGITGCDWFNTSVLGKSKKEMTEKKDTEKENQDSIRRAELLKYEALKAREEEQAKNQVPKPYHIIVGAFEEKPNADNMSALFRSNGYNTVLFDYGGLTHVSAISFETLQEAETALRNMLNLSYCPEDAWIFKR
ncbi:MAG: SPOR domain-containing protein [Prevotellaceae bacterium]|jgi:cell division septation protein DedD|nr:SPOR domain-containing protein [Prevotellaceae bacterium]